MGKGAAGIERGPEGPKVERPKGHEVLDGVEEEAHAGVQWLHGPKGPSTVYSSSS